MVDSTSSNTTPELGLLLKNKYRLGEVLGKGGWGTVYKGWNLQTGDFVAIKQIQLTKLPKDQLAGIMSEISLLQNLHHPRIVKYIDSIKTDDALYIVLEYVENGSLERIVTKFGPFPEHLIAVYIAQVLEGLVYLHEQGVIHRDIKGANILTTKTGHIKLADFGIATKQGTNDEFEEPAGSPYWMAPEVIEMNPITTTADIWSVGCTIIELSTGKPPYYDLDPMPAMFRIVQDDCPPIPENLSPGLKDFLLQCFQKEPLLRQSADKLLKHRWLTSTLKKLEAERASSAAIDNIAVQEVVQDWNKKLKERREEIRHSPFKPIPSSPNGEVSHRSSKSSKSSKDKSMRRKDSHYDRDKKSTRRSTSKKESHSHSKESNKKSSEKNSVPSTPVSKSKTAKLNEFKEDFDDDWDNDFDDAPAKPAPKQLEKTLTPPSSAESSPAPAKAAQLKLKSFSEADNALDDDNWDDFDLGDSSGLSGSVSSNASQLSLSGAAADLASRLKAKLDQAWDEQQDDDDIFDTFDDGDDDFNQDEALLRDELAKLTTEAAKAFLSLQPDKSEQEILTSCDQLVNIFKGHPEHKTQLIGQTGVIPLIEMLRSCANFESSAGTPKSDVVERVLSVANHVIEENKFIAESFCVMGGIPSVIRFAGRANARSVRLEVAKFVRQVLKFGKKTVKMFIASGGLPVLIDFLDIPDAANYVANKDLCLCGVDCIYDVLTLNLHIHIPKNDFCRLLAKAGLLPHLAQVFQYVLDDKELRPSQIDLYADKIGDLFIIFSNADPIVKHHFCEQDVLKLIFRQLDRLSKTRTSVFSKLLKAIKTLSNLSTTLDHLQRAGAIKTLVPLMGEESFSVETRMLIYSALFNLCRLDRKRQAEAARMGIIVHFIKCIRDNSPLKQFALPIMYEFRTKKTRAELWKHDGIKFYLDMFDQQFPWQIQAIDALAEWLSDEPKKVSPILEEHYERFIHVFVSARDEALTSMVEPLHRILTLSPGLSRLLGASSFITDVISRLKHHNPHVRVFLLKIIRCLLEASASPRDLIRKHNLAAVVAAMESDSRVLVSEMAREISAAIQRVKRGGMVRVVSQAQL